MKRTLIILLASISLTGCFGVQLVIKKFKNVENYSHAQKRFYTSVTNFISNATTTNSHKISK